MNQKDTKKFQVRIKKIRREKAVDGDLAALANALVGKKQTQVIDSALMAGILKPDQIAELLVNTKACPNFDAALKRIKRHFKNDIDRRIKHREIVRA